MGLHNEYDFDLIVNDVQKLVIEEMEVQLNTSEFKNVCRCQDCILDIAALAMNHLKPAYRSTLSYKGVMYRQKLETDSYKNAVKKVVSDSINKVKNNPSHESQ